jgi:hypothetical protein
MLSADILFYFKEVCVAEEIINLTHFLLSLPLSLPPSPSLPSSLPSVLFSVMGD